MHAESQQHQQNTTTERGFGCKFIKPKRFIFAWQNVCNQYIHWQSETGWKGGRDIYRKRKHEPVQNFRCFYLVTLRLNMCAWILSNEFSTRMNRLLPAINIFLPFSTIHFTLYILNTVLLRYFLYMHFLYLNAHKRPVLFNFKCKSQTNVKCKHEWKDAERERERGKINYIHQIIMEITESENIHNRNNIFIWNPDKRFISDSCSSPFIYNVDQKINIVIFNGNPLCGQPLCSWIKKSNSSV